MSKYKSEKILINVKNWSNMQSVVFIKKHKKIALYVGAYKTTIKVFFSKKEVNYYYKKVNYNYNFWLNNSM